ncbi:putative nuclease HARBI1 [Lytechinus pictus]|uniref:putative nuclease HARBI1 n=1 Tax=Lytechinus pictus TaxID=7653 RepID=UPI0030BA1FBD
MDYLHHLHNLELLRELPLPRPRRGLRDARNPSESYEDGPFQDRYRLSKETVIYIINMLEAELKRDTQRNDPLPVYLQVLTALRFHAVGSFQKMHGDEAAISQSSMCRIIKDVSEAIARRKRQYMKFPSTREEVEATQRQFFQYCRFPGVIGAIDGTHVYIRSPGGDQAIYFLNRKNRYSINVQVVCDQAEKITSIVARWPGSTPNSATVSHFSTKLGW